MKTDIDHHASINIPEASKWKCYMFGNNPKTNHGICYVPVEGGVPNIFVRFMMRICFACIWVKTTSDNKSLDLTAKSSDKEECGLDCHYKEPYGFVHELDCPNG